MNNLDELFRVFLSRPLYQRIFLAFTLGAFMSCSMKVAQETPEPQIVGFVAGP
jgi:hypothetical protein